MADRKRSSAKSIGPSSATLNGFAPPDEDLAAIQKRLALHTSPNLMIASLKATDKIGALKELTDQLAKGGVVGDKLRFFETLMERENSFPTQSEKSVAFPHAIVPGKGKVMFAVGLSKKGIAFNPDDHERTHIIIAIAIPKKEIRSYMMLLSELSRLFHNARYRQTLRRCKNDEEMFALLS